MRTAGLSKVRLTRMHDRLADYVDRFEAPGIVTLVSRRGESCMSMRSAAHNVKRGEDEDTHLRIDG
jgi:hypothetical protein